ncbi:MAG: rod shape-determining protein RodA, partial [Roseobacter sp.]
MKRILSVIAAAMLLGAPAFAGGETPANPDAQVYFINLEDGQTVASPLRVKFGLRGMGVAPAGTEK